MANKKWSEVYAENPATLPLATTDIFCVTQGLESSGLTSLELADSLNFLNSRGFVTVGVQAQFETIAEAFSAGFFKVLVVSDITEIQNFTFSASLSYVVCIHCLPNITINYNGFSPFLGDSTTEFNLFEIIGGYHIPNSSTGIWIFLAGGFGNILKGNFYNFTLDLQGTDVSVGETAFFVENSSFFNLNIIYSGDDYTPQTVFVKCNLTNVTVKGTEGSSTSTVWGLLLQDCVASSIFINGSWDISLAETQIGGAIFTSDACSVSDVSVDELDDGLFAVIVSNLTGLSAKFAFSGKIVVLGDSPISNVSAQGSTILPLGSSKIQNCKFKNFEVASEFSLLYPYGPSFINVEFFDAAIPVSTDGMGSTPISFTSCTSKSGFVVNSNNASLINCVANPGTLATITVNSGSENTILVGNTTKLAIVDNGTNTELSANQLIV